MNIEANGVDEALSHIQSQIDELRQVFDTDLKQAQQPITDGAWVGEGQKTFTSEMTDKVYALAADLIAELETYRRVIYAAAGEIQHVDGVIKSKHVEAAEEAFAAIVQ
jgi:uncharacterized protein YukE